MDTLDFKSIATIYEDQKHSSEQNTNQDIVALKLILLFLMTENNLLYATYKDDLLYKNRYLPTENMQRLLDEVARHKESATKTIRKGSIFYRARIVDDAFKVNRLKNLLSTFTDLSGTDFLDIRALKYLDDGLFLMLIQLFFEHNASADITLPEELFSGYGEKDSGAAPPDKVAAGRLNPEKISFLYTAKSKYTSVCEVKPYIGQNVSVAKFKTNKTLKMLDLTKHFPNEKISEEDGALSRIHILRVIAHEFQKPNHNDSTDYLPTQYITEFAKEVLKYDGIYFRSSLDAKGINAVFFNPNACDFLSSELIHIKNIKLSY